MAWQVPKANWLNTDAIPHTELNKYGADINTLRNIYTMSGSGRGWGSSPVSPLTTTIFQTIVVTVPAGHSLLIHHASAYFYSSWLRLRVLPQVGYGTAYTSASNSFDVFPDFSIYDNFTAATVVIAAAVGAYNSNAGGSAAINDADGWTTRISVSPI